MSYNYKSRADTYIVVSGSPRGKERKKKKKNANILFFFSFLLVAVMNS